jgi:glycosyltransferase involved in cell wall biosynthesis
MKPTEPTISIIIPTHNRVTSLFWLLEKFRLQTYPVYQMEVIVIPNNCVDSTISRLHTYQAPYRLHFRESFGECPAAARNLGASLATGDLLIFLDDDVDPSEKFVESHVMAHNNRKDLVVIGYLPLATLLKSDFFKISLRTYWEEKFHKMQNPYYIYNYTDLLSGNFSLSSDLFKRSKGFDTNLRCREDYELGIRLLQSGAEFTFSKDAWGLHKDEVTNLHRSLKRKVEEGRADVKLWYLHQGLITRPLQKSRLKGISAFVLTKARFLLFPSFKVFEVITPFIKRVMVLLERLRLRSNWNALNLFLLKYWYYRGVLEELYSNKDVMEYFNYISESETFYEDLHIDVKEGIHAATQILDQTCPKNIKLFYGASKIGTIPYRPCAEQIRGKHLRHMLTTWFAEPFAASIAFDELKNKSVESDQILRTT